ncbi:MAG: site-specific integrase [Thaumarchaeota archaeon]|nr:site-specific integrase [Nitrososphaerota archaeon]
MRNSNETNAIKVLDRTLKRIGPSEAVRRFLSKYGPVTTRRDYAESLLKYFVWLKTIGVTLMPDELITDNLMNVFKSDPTDVATKRRHNDWLLQYVNGYSIEKGFSQGYRVHAATVIRKFYARNDSSLHGDFQLSYERPKEVKKALLPGDVRAVLKALPVHVRLPYLLAWQGGLEIDKILSLRWKDIHEGLEKGERPLKLTFSGRKRMIRPYFTFLGSDSIDLLLQWRENRAEQLKELKREPSGDELVLVGKDGRPMDYGWLRVCLKKKAAELASAGLIKGFDSASWHPHSFRKSFRTEAAHAGVAMDTVEFWMGHDRGVIAIYNRSDEVHEDDFRIEYLKLEPFVSLNQTEATMKKEFDMFKYKTNSAFWAEFHGHSIHHGIYSHAGAASPNAIIEGVSGNITATDPATGQAISSPTHFTT